jgi:bacteriochlorophyll 4-vinyl reductase
MREAGIGRVLVASLHQGIADILPTRLTFYENWLNAEGLREGTIGLAPLYAVLSFLRQEGDAYQMITTRAGEYAAEWTVQSMPPLRRATIKAVPAWLRSRMLLRIAGQLVRNTYQGSRVISRQRRGLVSVDLRASIFCTVREPVHHPLCGFYAAAFTRLLELFNMRARAEMVACRGTGEPTCVMKLALLNGQTATARAAHDPHHERAHDHAVAHDMAEHE